MSKYRINVIKNTNLIKVKFIKWLLILTMITMSKNVFGFGFVSLGSLTDGNQGYYLEYGVPIFIVPVGFHYESNDRRPSLFVGLVLPACPLVFTGVQTECDFLYSLQFGHNGDYHYRRLGLTMLTSYKMDTFFVNISYRQKLGRDEGSYKNSDGSSNESLLFGVSYLLP